jgi:UDP-N-acetylglucosamine 2-epimerase
MAEAVNPYGDGRAAERICAALAGREVSPFTP